MPNEALLVELNQIEVAIATLQNLPPGPTREAALAPLLEKQASLQARLGQGFMVQGSHFTTGDRGVAGSSASENIITGDYNKIAETLIESQTIVQATDPEQAGQSRLRQRCLRLLAHRCNILPLATLGGEESAKAEVTLADVYVSLNTKTRLSQTEAEKKERRSLSVDRPLTALEVATEYPRMVLLGDPGSGKSTFVQQLTARLALVRLGEEEPLPDWPAQAWPMLTLLRDLSPHLAAISLDDPITESQEAALVAAMLAQWQANLAQLDAASLAADLPTLLTDEPIVLIFDGLDEVPEATRRHVRLAVQAVLRAYPAIERVIITCRIRSYTGPAILPDFTSHTLTPFNDKQIQTFIKAWYNAQTRLGRLTASQAADRASDLQEAALSSHLYELAQNPMLLTTMALIHQREVGLPRERVRLYDEAVKVLLTRWQKRKEIAVSDSLQAALNDQLRLRQMMERLAYEVHRRQSRNHANDSTAQGDLPRLEALGLLEEKRYLGDIGLAHEFLDYADQRTGLLHGRGGEEGRQATAYTFPHRTFQEYLAGCYMVTGRQRQVAQEYWQRVAEGDFWYLAGQLGAEELLYNRRDPEAMLDLAYTLCPSDPPATPAEWRAIVWSGQMAVRRGLAEIVIDTGGREEGANYLHRLRERLKQALRQSNLKAFERTEADRALAVLGDNRPGVGRRADGLPDITWCEIPAGRFVRGSKSDRFSIAKETPRQTVNLPAFNISLYPITNAQYATFVIDGGYTDKWRCCWTKTGWQWKRKRSGPEKYRGISDLPNHPIVGVSWYEAIAFCNWLTEQFRLVGELSFDEVITLPSENQWEKAATGPKSRVYPWGNQADPERANYEATGIEATTAVGCFPGGTSLYGVEEMAGNIWEWCRTKYEESYQNYQDDNELEEDAPRMLRGGAFVNNDRRIRCAVRLTNYPYSRERFYGFRVCRMGVSSS